MVYAPADHNILMILLDAIVKRKSDPPLDPTNSTVFLFHLSPFFDRTKFSLIIAMEILRGRVAKVQMARRTTCFDDRKIVKRVR